MAGASSTGGKGFGDHRYRSLIAALVEARKAAQLSQADLAQRIHHHQQFVSRFETGERRLDAVEFADIARALGCDPAALVASIPPVEGPKS